MVEHRTAVPVVIGSNPIVPFFAKRGEKGEGREKTKKGRGRVYQGFVVKR